MSEPSLDSAKGVLRLLNPAGSLNLEHLRPKLLSLLGLSIRIFKLARLVGTGGNSRSEHSGLQLCKGCLPRKETSRSQKPDDWNAKGLQRQRINTREGCKKRSVHAFFAPAEGRKRTAKGKFPNSFMLNS